MTGEARKKLRNLTNAAPNNFHQMAATSRDIIDCWVSLGYDYPSPYIDEFASIDSQADEARLLGSEEQEQFFNAFQEIFVKELKNLRAFISTSKRVITKQ